MVSYDSREAADAAVSAGEQVCACLLPDGTPRYFLMPDDADDLQVQHAAFRVRNGRDMTGAEKVLAVLQVDRAAD